jgi:hypothetical protein
MRAALIGWLLGVLLVACATPVPTPPVSPSLATPMSSQPAAEPTLYVGGIAAVMGFIHLELAAGADPSPGQPDAGDIETGSLAYVLAGPERRTGIDWWEVQSERSYDVGWAPTAIDDTPVLAAIDPACPSKATLTVDQLVGIGRVRGLVCFGDDPLTFDATVTCQSGVLDGGPGGASWMDSYRFCHTIGDPSMGLHGDAITSSLGRDLAANPVTARFRITGHFDDPESSRCWMVPVGVNLDASGPADPHAVIDCRESFVVTEAVHLGDAG